MMSTTTTTTATTKKGRNDCIIRSRLEVSLTSFPTFTGKINEWLSFRRKFCATLSVYGLDHVIDSDYPYPGKEEQDDDDLENNQQSLENKITPSERAKKRELVYNEKEDEFVLYILEYVTAEGTAWRIIKRNKNTSSGARAWKDLMKIFDDKDYHRARAMARIQDICLNRRSPGDVQAYIRNFLFAVTDLETIGEPYSELVQAISFLKNIEHSHFETTKDKLRKSGDFKSLDKCISAISIAALDD